MSHISAHHSNDDLRHYQFTRNSGLPLGTFPRARRINPDRVVFAACIAIVVLLIAATGAI